MHKLPVTALIQTKNEERGIRACIEGLVHFSEIIVVDSNSTDETKEIATRLGVQVINFSWDGKYPKKKQWQLENIPVSNKWVMFFDADEKPTPALLEEIREALTDADQRGVKAFDVPLSYRFAGRTLRYGHRVVKRCLLQPAYVFFPDVGDILGPGMGELEGHYQPTVHGRVARLKARLHHDDPDPMRSWFDRHNRYSDWEAYLRANAGPAKAVGKLKSAQGRVFDSVPFKPAIFFLYAYFLRLGFLDGREGFDYAFALAGYYWQVGLKFRELQRNSNGTLG